LRDFWGRSIFDFINNIGAKRTMEKVSDRWLSKTAPGTPRAALSTKTKLPKKSPRKLRWSSRE
jgi:hypothetical protein